MNPNSQNPVDEEFELQPSGAEPHAPEKTGAPALPSTSEPEAPDASQDEPLEELSPTEAAQELGTELGTLADEAPRDAAAIPDGPPPSDKVDFENLPEFVWQREMLRTVRLVAVFVTLIVVIVLIVAFFGAGKGAKDSLKNVIEPEQPAQESKP